jgi:two-component system, LuxR family, response regulator FixJ
MPRNTEVFIVEDDDATRDALSRLLRAEGLRVRSYASAEAFLGDYDPTLKGCLLADVRLPGINGIELMHKLVREKASLSVVIITGHGDVPLAVAAIKAGAFDFIEKPFDPDGLVESVRKALAKGAAVSESVPGLADLNARLAQLSPRERQVMELVVGGHHNKAIAASLGISPRTVEVYRANVMTKMGAGSLTDLIGLALRLRDAG